jgi:hypothetical protein
MGERFGPGQGDQPTFPDPAADPRATIVERTRHPKQRGRYRRRAWLLRIEPQPHAMGGAPVELAFDTLEQAEAYARRANLHYEVVSADPDRGTRGGEPPASSGDTQAWAYIWAVLLRARYGLCDPPLLPEIERAFSAPSATFASPWYVVAHPVLDDTVKRAILERWGLDELALERLADDGGIAGDGSRLDEVRSAALALNVSLGADAPEFGPRAPDDAGLRVE